MHATRASASEHVSNELRMVLVRTESHTAALWHAMQKLLQKLVLRLRSTADYRMLSPTPWGLISAAASSEPAVFR